MKKRRNGKDGKNENEKNKIPKMERKECSINDLPKVLIEFLGFFLDLDGLLYFSSTNQKHKRIFSEFRKTFRILKEIGFLFEYFEDTNQQKTIQQKKESLKIKLINKDISDLIILFRPNEEIYEKFPLQKLFECENISIETIKYLVENKCDLKKTNEFNDSFLHLACENKEISIETIKYLVENKILIRSRGYNDNTPLHLACLNENISLETIKYLVENKCETNLINRIDETPLHLACLNEYTSIEIIQFLIENKSDLNLMNGWNQIPLKLASMNENLSKKFHEKKINMEFFFKNN